MAPERSGVERAVGHLPVTSSARRREQHLDEGGEPVALPGSQTREAGSACAGPLYADRARQIAGAVEREARRGTGRLRRPGCTGRRDDGEGRRIPREQRSRRPSPAPSVSRRRSDWSVDREVHRIVPVGRVSTRVSPLPSAARTPVSRSCGGPDVVADHRSEVPVGIGVFEQDLGVDVGDVATADASELSAPRPLHEGPPAPSPIAKPPAPGARAATTRADAGARLRMRERLQDQAVVLECPQHFHRSILRRLRYLVTTTSANSQVTLPSRSSTPMPRT